MAWLGLRREALSTAAEDGREKRGGSLRAITRRWGNHAPLGSQAALVNARLAAQLVAQLRKLLCPPRQLLRHLKALLQLRGEHRREAK